VIAAIASVGLRAVLGRRRMVLLVLLAAVPVLLALLLRAGGTTGGAAIGPAGVASNVIELLIVRVVLPLIALVLGTGVLGSELEDGTAVYLLTKPVPRWQIVAAKVLVAAGVSIVLSGLSTLLTALIIGAGTDVSSLAVGFTIATALGAAAYCALFLALSIVTTRAFIVGLIYTLVWEGVLAGLFEGTQLLSIRQYVIGLATGLAGGQVRTTATTVGMLPAAIGLVVVFVAALTLATVQLSNAEVRPAD
jgi:ABC-2 type transport system permease protein